MAIGNKLIFDINGNVEDFTFILSTKDFRHLGAIQNVIPESVHHVGNMASADEISFEVYKTVEKEINEEIKEVEEPLWNELTNLKLIYIRELDEYYEANVQLDDTTDVIKKTITCTSLCEAELAQLYIHGLEINTESDISRDDYKPTVFYNKSNPSASLLHRVFSFAPQYTIKHVDESLINLQRTFSVDNTAIYDWLIGDCANEFKCLFIFDSTNRGVYVYDLYTVCKNCGHRAEYIGKCPECGSTNLEYFGDDTTIFVDKENLTDAIQFTTDIGSIKNCFKLIAGDDTITSTVRMLNMNGTNFIYKPTDEQLNEMPQELKDKLITYDNLYLSYKDKYEEIVLKIYEAIDKINYYTHSMMPTIEQSEITAQSEADKLIVGNLSPLGLSTVTSSTSISTVESALKNYAKVYIKSGYVKIDVNSSNYKYVGKDSNGYNYGTWTGNFKVTNYSDSEDIAYSEIISVKVYDNYQDFIEQKIMKNVVNNSDEEDSVFDVLSIDELGDFKQALKLYCLNRLTSFYDAIQSALDVLIEVDQASESADLYEPLYMPYYDKLQACQNEIDSRQATIDEWQNTYDNLVLRQQEIQADLNFQDYLGEELYKIFCMYKREDTYQNDNYISDGLSDSEIIQKAKDFLEVAQKELEKARTPNHSISSTLHNLLIMPEFKPIIDNFKLGNWLRICVDGIVYRLRLIGYELSFSSIQTLSVEFSNVTKLNTIANETKNILDSAKSMVSNFDYFVAQAKRGNEANVEITHWLEDGLQSALVNIKNNNNEEITFDKHGLWAKTYNSETGNYDPEMFRLTHNILAYTTDGFKTVKAALGKHNYYKFDESGKLVQDTAYGISCDFVTAGYIYGSQIISGDIYSENYSSTTGSHINLKTGAFTLGSGKIVYNPVTNKLEIKGVNIEWSSSTTPEISDIDGLTEDLAQKSASITANADAITAEVKRASKAEGDLSASIKINADAITSEVKRATESEGNLSSKIEQTADSITSTVNKQITETKTYADTVAENAKNDAISDSAEKLKSYSTTTEMNSAINQKADSITSTVNKQITETKEYIDGEIETTKSDLSSEIKQTAESITSTVSETYETKENADREYKRLQSSIEQTSNSIALTVSQLQTQVDDVSENLETNYSTTIQMESAIEMNTKNITLFVEEEIKKTETYAENLANDAESNANSATDNKLKSYSTTTEMNSSIELTAKSITSSVEEQIGETKEYIDGEISTTKTTLSSEIEQTAKSITQTVQATYETKENADAEYKNLQSSIEQTAESITQTVTSLQTDFDNLEFGGTNLLPDSNIASLKAVACNGDRYFSDNTNTSITMEFIDVTDAPLSAITTGVKATVIAITEEGKNLTWRNIPLTDGETYTMSYYARITNGTKARLRFRYRVMGYSYVGGYQEFTETKWTKVSHTFTVDKSKSTTDNTASDLYAIGLGGVIGAYIGTIEMCGFKLEKGNKSTDWNLAVNDTTKAITTLESSITQTADEIELKVKEVSESTTDLQGQIDNTNKNLETNYSTTAEMESAIEIKADNITSSVTKYIDDEISTTKSDLSSEITQTAQSITSTVSETYETKTDAGVKYDELQSSIKQTADSIELKVSTEDVCSTISQSSDKISIKSNRLEIESDYFTLAPNGECVAKKLYVESIQTSDYANFLSNDTENGGVYTNANIYAEGEISCKGSLYAGTDLTVEGGIYAGTDLTVMGDASVHGTFWAASGTIDSSDRNVKNSIETLDYDKTCDFIYSLIPRKYKYNSGSSDRFHHGLIAQELKESMNNEDWGVFVDNTEAGGHLGIRYQELIADLITVVQVQNKRISELESKLL